MYAFISRSRTCVRLCIFSAPSSSHTLGFIVFINVQYYHLLDPPVNHTFLAIANCRCECRIQFDVLVNVMLS